MQCPSFVSCFSLSGCLSLAMSGKICSGSATLPMFVHHSIFIGFINVWPPRYWMVWVYQWICWRQNMQETRRFCHRLRQKPLHWTSLWWLSLANVWWLDPNVCWLDHITYFSYLSLLVYWFHTQNAPLFPPFRDVFPQWIIHKRPRNNWYSNRGWEKLISKDFKVWKLT